MSKAVENNHKNHNIISGFNIQGLNRKYFIKNVDL